MSRSGCFRCRWGHTLFVTVVMGDRDARVVYYPMALHKRLANIIAKYVQEEREYGARGRG